MAEEDTPLLFPTFYTFYVHTISIVAHTSIPGKSVNIFNVFRTFFMVKLYFDVEETGQQTERELFHKGIKLHWLRSL